MRACVHAYVCTPHSSAALTAAAHDGSRRQRLSTWLKQQLKAAAEVAEAIHMAAQCGS